MQYRVPAIQGMPCPEISIIFISGRTLPQEESSSAHTPSRLDIHRSTASRDLNAIPANDGFSRMQSSSRSCCCGLVAEAQDELEPRRRVGLSEAPSRAEVGSEPCLCSKCGGGVRYRDRPTLFFAFGEGMSCRRSLYRSPVCDGTENRITLLHCFPGERISLRIRDHGVAFLLQPSVGALARSGAQRDHVTVRARSASNRNAAKLLVEWFCQPIPSKSLDWTQTMILTYIHTYGSKAKQVCFEVYFCASFAEHAESPPVDSYWLRCGPPVCPSLRAAEFFCPLNRFDCTMPGLLLGDVFPNFEADTTIGKIQFHDFLGDSCMNSS
ncbi:PRDX6 protein, partial [Polyodon spathula]|nr:PRDX6 protein [Polyodon spathula]